MTALAKAVAAQEDDALHCVRAERAVGKTKLSCSFGGAGQVSRCEPVGGRGFSKSQLACITAVFAKLSISQAEWVKVGSPAKCVAQIQVVSERQPYRRPGGAATSW